MSYGKLQLLEHSYWQAEKRVYDNEDEEVFGLTNTTVFYRISQCIMRSDGLHLVFEAGEIHFNPETHVGNYNFGSTQFRGDGEIIDLREAKTAEFLRYIVLTAKDRRGTRFVIRVGISDYSATDKTNEPQAEP